MRDSLAVVSGSDLKQVNINSWIQDKIAEIQLSSSGTFPTSSLTDTHTGAKVLPSVFQPVDKIQTKIMFVHYISVHQRCSSFHFLVHLNSPVTSDIVEGDGLGNAEAY